jgi:hypothetical protein
MDSNQLQQSGKNLKCTPYQMYRLLYLFLFLHQEQNRG